MVKLVVCDLDGTLLRDDKTIGDFSAKMLQSVRRGGGKVCFASGRDEQMMQVYASCIGGVDYLLSNNGAMVRDGDGQVIHQAFLQPQDVREILEYLDEREMTYMMYAADVMYYSEASARMEKRIRDYEALTARIGFPVHLTARELKRHSCFFCENAVKIVAYEDEEGRAQEYREYLGTKETVHYETTGYGLYGAFHREVSKKSALQKVMKTLGLRREEVCVFGDYDNDLSMFECAAHRIAMGNGSHSVKEKATAVTVSNNEDGVGRYLDRMFREGLFSL